jgi:hypothetical protein
MADEPTVYPTEAVWVRDPAVGGEPYKGFPFPGLERLRVDPAGNLELDKTGKPVADKAKEASK